jgi:dihydrofolate synthase/folylpolyglutamate synthase
VRPSYFEAVSAAAFRWFADVAVDVAVVEVGLLGRWDATNVCERRWRSSPTSASITPSTPARRSLHIATEKAGIVKPGSAVVIGETDPELAHAFIAAGGASHFLRGPDFDVVENHLALGGRMVDLRTPTTVYPDVFVPLHGRHQGDNAAVALTAVEAFFASPVPGELVAEGFARSSCPAASRCSVTSRWSSSTARTTRPAPTRARRCSSTTSTLPAAASSSSAVCRVAIRARCSALRRRRVRCGDHVHRSRRRAAWMPTELTAAARAMGCDQVIEHATIEQAIDRALAMAESDDADPDHRLALRRGWRPPLPPQSPLTRLSVKRGRVGSVGGHV